jgi:hypothetical protein
MVSAGKNDMPRVYFSAAGDPAFCRVTAAVTDSAHRSRVLACKADYAGQRQADRQMVFSVRLRIEE